jgi:hypothetical protein
MAKHNIGRSKNCANVTAIAFATACNMEEPLTTIRDLLDALALISEALDQQHGLVVQRLAWLAKKQWEDIEQMRGDLFTASHPSRDEEAGQPAAEAA